MWIMPALKSPRPGVSSASQGDRVTDRGPPAPCRKRGAAAARSRRITHRSRWNVPPIALKRPRSEVVAEFAAPSLRPPVSNGLSDARAPVAHDPLDRIYSNGHSCGDDGGARMFRLTVR